MIPMPGFAKKLWNSLGEQPKPEREPELNKSDILELKEDIGELGMHVPASKYLVADIGDKNYTLLQRDNEDGVAAVRVDLPFAFVENNFVHADETVWDVVRQHERGGEEGAKTEIELGMHHTPEIL